MLFHHDVRVTSLWVSDTLGLSHFSLESAFKSVFCPYIHGHGLSEERIAVTPELLEYCMAVICVYVIDRMQERENKKGTDQAVMNTISSAWK